MAAKAMVLSALQCMCMLMLLLFPCWLLHRVGDWREHRLQVNGAV
jgi:hypothetical protein